MYVHQVSQMWGSSGRPLAPPYYELTTAHDEVDGKRLLNRLVEDWEKTNAGKGKFHHVDFYGFHAMIRHSKGIREEVAVLLTPVEPDSTIDLTK